MSATGATAPEAPEAPERLLRVLVGFTTALRHAGLPVSNERVTSFLAALDVLGVTSESQAYWAGRLTLCGDPDDVARYDAAFPAWFSGDRQHGSNGATERMAPRLAALSRSAEAASDAGGVDEQPAHRVSASAVEVLRHRDLGELSPAEREHLRRMLGLLRPAPPSRASRRRHPARRGEPDPRRTLSAALKAGGELTGLRRRHRSPRPRRVVMLIDVSGSMSPYANALLRFSHVVLRHAPGATEVFTLGTRLTRVTRELGQRDSELALAAAGNAIPDWSGGTRLGEVLQAFLDRWGQRGVARGAVVVVFSDGWERGKPELLAEQLARLHRLAHRLIWVNPHAGKAGYAPVQGGIVAALPHVDQLLAGHSVATLERLLEVVRDA